MYVCIDFPAHISQFAVYNWTARHADRGYSLIAANVERQLELQAIEA